MRRTGEPGTLPAAVVDFARRKGTITRVELADELDVTPATITNVVKRLLKDGLLVEVGYGESTGGKRPSLLRLNASSRFAIGISSGFTAMNAVLTDLRGHMLGAVALPNPESADDDHAGPLADELASFLDAMGVSRSEVMGVGLAAQRPEAGETASAVLLAQGLEETLELPVVVQDDATCVALGEYWAGAGEGGRRFATVYMGDHITAGFLNDGRPFSETSRGSLGHVSVDPGGEQCPCGSRGCLEIVAAPAAVVRNAVQRPLLRRSLELRGEPGSLRRDFAAICRAAVTGNPQCEDLIRESAQAIGWAINDLAALLGLERVYLAGPGFTFAGAIYAREIRAVTSGVVGPAGGQPVDVQVSRIDLEAAALGAASLVMQATMPQVTGAAS